jgi:hypothetical protein
MNPFPLDAAHLLAAAAMQGLALAGLASCACLVPALLAPWAGRRMRYVLLSCAHAAASLCAPPNTCNRGTKSVINTCVHHNSRGSLGFWSVAQTHGLPEEAAEGSGCTVCAAWRPRVPPRPFTTHIHRSGTAHASLLDCMRYRDWALPPRTCTPHSKASPLSSPAWILPL